METTTSFDLNRAIQQWRENLAQLPAIRSENLDELETHLRDSVATLQTPELSVEEAFLVATRRVGNNAVLGKEFGKVNAVNIWVERCLWALITMQIWAVLQSLFVSIGSLSQLVSVNLSRSSFGWSTIILIVLGTTIPMAATALIIWRLFKSPESKIGNFLEKISNQPVTLAALLFVLNAGGHLFYSYSLNYLNNSYGGTSWVAYIYFLPGSLCYAGLIFFLARKRLLQKA
ncbi:MAG: hypothetical protein WDM76_13965 [Limisphaerales bacterium]